MPSRRKTKVRAPRSADIEEVQPQRFLVRDMRARPMLKGEGTFQGVLFTLTTWRRDGLIARLRESGFVVYTLEDRVHALPGLPLARTIGEAYPRSVSGVDRYSYFDPQTLAWVTVAPMEGTEQPTVQLREEWIVRRRRGRGSATYYRVVREGRGAAGLTPVSEAEALLQGYAQAAPYQHTLKVSHRHPHYTLPALALPGLHHDLLQRLAEATETGWRVEEGAWPLVQQIFKGLGLKLVVTQSKR